ncbi:sorting nexin-21 [Schistocerca piceifrons]|uniref:sorting nexin-21 n=1 Tax=Schistocerca piceifrons TaxID=274613 RepID=UPI001F5F96D2|nr:sorting nexin-21 [Schistocerca piceifrons]
MNDKTDNLLNGGQDLENLVLGEEPDTRLEQGTLSFSETPGAHSEASAHIKSWSKVKRGVISSHNSTEENEVDDAAIFAEPVLKFEIVSARTVEKENEKKHVAYTLMIRKDSVQPDPNPAVIERRYTDFLELYDGLRRNFPALMTGIPFPRKVLTGNLNPSLISARSSGFEALLEHIGRDTQLRESAALMNFLQNREEAEARHWMQAQQYDQAVPLLENIFRLLNKLYTDRHPAVLLALCRLVACSHAAGESARPERFADLALHRYEAVSDIDLLRFYVPLLQLCVRLWWALGRDKRPLEARLDDLRRRGIKVDGCPSLLDAITEFDSKK